MHLAHTCPGYEKILTKGLNGVKKQVEKKLEGLNPTETEDFSKFQFYKAVNITLDAAAALLKGMHSLPEVWLKQRQTPKGKPN